MNVIKIKRGLKINLPSLAVGELGYCTDTNELFIGTNGGNILVNDYSEIEGDIEDLVNAISNLTKEDVGLANVLNVEQASQSDFNSHVTDSTNPHSVTKTQVGLSAVTNDAQVRRNEMGAANGVATLDSNTKVPLSQLPDTAKQQVYVVSTLNNLPSSDLIIGDKGFALDTSNSYIWDGTEWKLLSSADWENVSLEWENISGKPTEFTPESHVHSADDITSGTMSTSRLPAAALIGDTTYSAGTGISFTSGTTINVTNPFDPNGTYASLRAQATTKGDVGLGSVLNYGIATQEEAEAGTVSNKYMTPQRTKQAIEELVDISNATIDGGDF